MKVLIVDDDPALLRLLGLVMRSDGIEPVGVSDGAEALECLPSIKPHLIVLDLTMPNMDGRTFFVKARDRGFEGPIVICSAYGAAEAKRELGADAAVAKPFDPFGLVHLVKALGPPGV